MKILKYGFLIFSSYVLLAFRTAGVVSAQYVSYKIPNPSKIDSLEELIGWAGHVINVVILLTFGAMILYGAYLLMISRGRPDKIQESKLTFGAAIVGFIIAVMAPSISALIMGLLGVDTSIFEVT